MRVLLFFFIIISTSSCAYQFGLSERALPGGYKQLAIPVFKNSTQEVGIEMPFTNALIRRFGRSQVARVIDKGEAPVVLEGTIKTIKIGAEAPITNAQLVTLPNNVVLATSYRLTVTTVIVLKRKSDDKVVWSGSFQNEKVYSAPRIGGAVVNSANATYNHSARLEMLSQLAEEMMTEAHDRITENF